MKKFRIASMIAACVMAAGALAGCGDSGSGGSTKKSGGAVGEGGGNKTEKGAKQALEDFYDCYLTKNSAEDYYALMFPSDLMKKYKKENSDDYDDYMDDFNDQVEYLREEYKSISIKEFTDVEEIDDDFLDGAIYYYMNKASYFGIDRDDVDIDVSKGYEIKFKLELEDEDGDTETEKEVCCVVWIDGDGWKVLDGYEEEDLEDYAGYYKEYKEEEKDEKDDKFDD